MKKVLVVGATGDVGQGICAALMAEGHRVIATSRNASTLEALRQGLSAHGHLELVPGSVSTEEEGVALRKKVKDLVGTLDVVITSVNLKMGKLPLIERRAEELIEHLQGNLITQFIAAKTLIPAIVEGGMYLSIGGGMADFIVPGNGLSAVAQAAQRNMIRMIAREARGGPVMIRELLLYSHITGVSNRANADPAWFTDEECGRHVLAVLSQPEKFQGPILALKSREQVGRPEPQAKSR